MVGDLSQALQAIGPALRLADHPWWLIGSGAVALHGIEAGPVADLDVLLDERDCPAVFARLGVPVAPGKADDRFRSAVFQRWAGASLPVELFAGFALREQGVWRPLVPQTRLAIAVGGETVYVPEREELAEILRRFGRPKDLRRAAALSPSGRFPSRSGTV